MRDKEDKESRLTRIDRIVGYIVRIDIAILLVMLVLACFDISCRYAWLAGGIVFALGLLCHACLSPFVKSEEEEDFEKKVEYILQQKGIKAAIPSDFSPLRNLTEQQEERVKKLLRELPANTNHPRAINLALVARYLTALQEMGKADLSKRHALRMWIADVTGKSVPGMSQFNEALPSTYRQKIAEARAEIEPLLQ